MDKEGVTGFDYMVGVSFVRLRHPLDDKETMHSQEGGLCIEMIGVWWVCRRSGVSGKPSVSHVWKVFDQSRQRGRDCDTYPPFRRAGHKPLLGFTTSQGFMPSSPKRGVSGRTGQTLTQTI
jgi:hypothetical protein